MVSNDAVQVTQGVPDQVSVFAVSMAAIDQLDITWTAPNDYNSAITSYILERESPVGGGFVPLITLGNVTSHSDPGLISVTEYNYRITAVNAYGSGPTNTASAVTLPLPPTGVVVTPNSSSSELIVTWNTPALTSGITGYQVIREDGIGTGFTPITITTGTTFTDTGLTDNIYYNYKLKSVTSQGSSTSSNTYAQTTFHLPDGVQSLTATSGDFIDAGLSWTAPATPYGYVTGYEIYQSTTGTPNILVDSTSATSYTATNLDPTITYYWLVAPVTIHGTNSTGNIVNATATSENVLGAIVIPTTVNPDQVPILFDQSYSGNSTIVKINYDSVLNVNCDVDYKFASTSTTYSNLAETAELNGMASHTMTFNNSDNDIVEMLCYDSTDSSIKGKHLLTMTTIPFKTQTDSFKNGDYGLVGQFGSLDLITLFVVLIAMVGFNRYNPAVGVGIMSVIIMGLAWAGIIEKVTVIGGILTMVMILAIVISKRRSA